jgi:hypothetical protein
MATHPRACDLSDRDDSLLVPLADAANKSIGQIEIRHSDTNQLRDPQAAGVEQPEAAILLES